MLERPDAYRLKAIELSMADPSSMGVIKGLEEVYPELAKKLFEGNHLMERLVMSGMNMNHIMDYPICGKCETLALYSGWNQCTCTKTGCNSTTRNPATLREWLAYEMRKKMTPEQLEGLEYKIDAIAASMLRKFKADCRRVYEQHNAIASIKMKAPKFVSAQAQPEVDNVKHGGISELPADTIFIPDSAQEEV